MTFRFCTLWYRAVHNLKCVLFMNIFLFFQLNTKTNSLYLNIKMNRFSFHFELDHCSKSHHRFLHFFICSGVERDPFAFDVFRSRRHHRRGRVRAAVHGFHKNMDSSKHGIRGKASLLLSFIRGTASFLVYFIRGKASNGLLYSPFRGTFLAVKNTGSERPS